MKRCREILEMLAEEWPRGLTVSTLGYRLATRSDEVRGKLQYLQSNGLADRYFIRGERPAKWFASSAAAEAHRLYTLLGSDA